MVKWSKGKNDECYTPKKGVEPLLEFIPKDKIVWCPFDTQDSWFVKLISKQNEVVYSHIDNGQDFYEYEPKEWDIMASNPPFGGKTNIFKRALLLGKPFALLMTNMWLNDATLYNMFMEAGKSFEFLFINERLKYTNGDNINFMSAYFCCDFLPNGKNQIRNIREKQWKKILS
jgi:hypothetical protein